MEKIADLPLGHSYVVEMKQFGDTLFIATDKGVFELVSVTDIQTIKTTYSLVPVEFVDKSCPQK